MSDRYLEGCVTCSGRAVELCVIGQPGTERDFCPDCIDAGRDADNFGRCYVCREGDHAHCIGVPCQCPCPPPDAHERQRLRDQALAKLTPEEIAALGVW